MLFTLNGGTSPLSDSLAYTAAIAALIAATSSSCSAVTEHYEHQKRKRKYNHRVPYQEYQKSV